MECGSHPQPSGWLRIACPPPPPSCPSGQISLPSEGIPTFLRETTTGYHRDSGDTIRSSCDRIMNAIQALDRFLQQTLDPLKARRYCDLILRPKGQRRFLGDLYHTIGSSFRVGLRDTRLSDLQRAQPGYSFSEVRGFGTPEISLNDGFEELMLNTGWLLIDTEGGFGIYQPEDMIDDQRQIQVKGAS